MIIITLLKAVPEKTTRVVTVGGVLKRAEMDLVMNPHDRKALDAADYVKRSLGGKVVAMSMGPEVKLTSIMGTLYNLAIEGIDENVILSDRRMAGADTLATSYAVSLGIKKVLDVNNAALNELISMIESGVSRGIIKSTANRLYEQNLLTNKVFSTIPSTKLSIIWNYFSGRITKEETLSQLNEAKESLKKFIIIAGIKTTDGETGSVGPQVAEQLSEELGISIPQITYVDDFHIDHKTGMLSVERTISTTVQKLETRLPVLLTISTEFRSRIALPSHKKSGRLDSYKGKVKKPTIWTGDSIQAKPERIGLPGSPTIVGPGIDIGKPVVQKYHNKTLIFKKNLDEFKFNGENIGPFHIDDVADDLPKELIDEFSKKGNIQKFNYTDLVGDLFGM